MPLHHVERGQQLTVTPRSAQQRVDLAEVDRPVHLNAMARPPWSHQAPAARIIVCFQWRLPPVGGIWNVAMSIINGRPFKAAAPCPNSQSLARRGSVRQLDGAMARSPWFHQAQAPAAPSASRPRSHDAHQASSNVMFTPSPPLDSSAASVVAAHLGASRALCMGHFFGRTIRNLLANLMAINPKCPWTNQAA